MRYVRTTYIEYLYPDSYTGSRITRRVRNRETSTITCPKKSFGFRFFDILSAIVEADGGRVKLSSPRLNVSPAHYCGGKVYGVPEMEQEYPNEYSYFVDLREMGEDGKALRCHTGDWVLLHSTDILLGVTHATMHAPVEHTNHTGQ